MEINTRHYDDVVILALTGRLDAMGAPRLLAAMEEVLAASGVRLVIDLRRADFLSSAGMKALLQGARLARSVGGDVRIAGARSQIKYVLHLTDVHQIIPLYASVVCATASYFSGDRG